MKLGQVVVKALNHILVSMANKNLASFVPDWVKGDRDKLKGKGMLNPDLKLPPADEAPLLRLDAWLAAVPSTQTSSATFV